MKEGTRRMKTLRLFFALMVLSVSSVALSCEGRQAGPAEPAQAQPAMEARQPAGFAAVEGPAPGPATPYEGELVSYARWMDASGDNLIILSKSGLPASRLHILQYRGNESVPFRVFSDGAEGCGTGGTAAFYGNGIWVGDADLDGYGEAMVLYHVDCAPGTGPLRLELVVLGQKEPMAIHGGTRLDPIAGPRVPPVTLPDEGLLAATEAVRAEAMALWKDAQFDLAKPPSWPGFFEYQRFDGALFRGDEPLWSLTVLPQYMLLSMPGVEGPAAIRYTSILAADGGLVIEGSGEIGGWTHGFRVSVKQETTKAPDGGEFPLSATIDWSDGTRLLGWGSLVE